MIDTATQRPLRVSKYGTADPYIDVSVPQLDQVQQLLDDHNVRYSVDELVVSLDGGPEMAVIDLGPGGDASRVQSILDANP
jgi:hypothetical protein